VVDTEGIAHEVRQSVMRLARRLRQQRPDNGLSQTKLVVLGRLDRAGPTTATALAESERIQPQSITRAIAELVAQDLVARRPHPTDRRQVLLEITPAGLEVITTDRRGRDEWLATAMATTLTPAEQEFLRVASTLLDRLAES
jgi:DNA-binding MarR family transcriptional regulator